MRKFKFRIFHPNIKHMIYEVLPITVGNEKLMQYIGIEDKNNKLIYEEDIVKTKWQHCGVTNFDYEITGKIEYNPINCAFMIYDHNDGTSHTIGSFSQEKMLEIEVIGNVYENPYIKGYS